MMRLSVWCVCVVCLCALFACPTVEVDEAVVPDGASSPLLDAGWEQISGDGPGRGDTLPNQDDPVTVEVKQDVAPDDAKSSFSLRWDGGFAEHNSLVRLRDGGLLLMVGVRGKAQLGDIKVDFPTQKVHCHLARLRPDGTIQWAHYLYAGSGSVCSDSQRTSLWVLGETVAFRAFAGDLLSPQKQKIQLPSGETSQGNRMRMPNKISTYKPRKLKTKGFSAKRGAAVDNGAHLKIALFFKGKRWSCNKIKTLHHAT